MTKRKRYIIHAVAAHILLSAVVTFMFFEVGLRSPIGFIFSLIGANLTPMIANWLFVGLSYARHDMPGNVSDYHDGPVHKDSVIIKRYPLMVSLVALAALLLPLFYGIL